VNTRSFSPSSFRAAYFGAHTHENFSQPAEIHLQYLYVDVHVDDNVAFRLGKWAPNGRGVAEERGRGRGKAKERHSPSVN